MAERSGLIGLEFIKRHPPRPFESRFRDWIDWVDGVDLFHSPAVRLGGPHTAPSACATELITSASRSYLPFAASLLRKQGRMVSVAVIAMQHDKFRSRLSGSISSSAAFWASFGRGNALERVVQISRIGYGILILAEVLKVIEY
jgi:hypothetical protein